MAGHPRVRAEVVPISGHRHTPGRRMVVPATGIIVGCTLVAFALWVAWLLNG